MSDKSAIEWTDATWNPVTGCTKVSPGCAHCYAEAITLRFGYGPAFLPGVAEIKVHPKRLDQPIRWKRGRKIFVNSMSDLFHEDIPESFVDRVFAVMALADQHIYQVLTKRPERMLEYMTAQGPNHLYDNAQARVALEAQIIANERGEDTSSPHWDLFLESWPPPKVWLGVSVENQHWADIRIPLLLQTPAAVRFLSVEPLLRAVDLRVWLGDDAMPCECPDAYRANWCVISSCNAHDGRGIDWVIVGGESGPRHRPMELDWVRSLRDQAVAAGVPFFYKQPGGTRPGGDATLDGRQWHEFPEVRL